MKSKLEIAFDRVLRKSSTSRDLAKLLLLLEPMKLNQVHHSESWSRPSKEIKKLDGSMFQVGYNFD